MSVAAVVGLIFHTAAHQAASKQDEHLFTCRDLWDPARCAGLRPVACSAAQRKFCAQTCESCTPLVVPVNVGFLVDGELPIPEDATPLLLEIGASDRNTMDVEVLPKAGFERAFLVTAEPLVDKYARGVTRRRPAKTVADKAEPLSQHHSRGFILPLAVSPVQPEVARDLVMSVPNGSSVRTMLQGHRSSGSRGATSSGSGALSVFNVGSNAGCASLAALGPKAGRDAASFGAWCSKKGMLQRYVWTVPLAQLLGWIGTRRVVDFVKIDAQGMDLQVVVSGGEALRTNVRRVGLEVISDDCNVLYAGQPKCSAVTEELARLGFEPLTPVPCTPPIARGRRNHFCELEIVFVNTVLRAAEGAAFDANIGATAVYQEHHRAHMNGCRGVYQVEEYQRLIERLRQGRVRAEPDARDVNATMLAAAGSGTMAVEYFSEGGTTATSHSNGTNYLCPQACFLSGPKVGPLHAACANSTHMCGYLWREGHATRKQAHALSVVVTVVERKLAYS